MSQTKTKLKGVNKDLWAMVITSITLLMTSLICLNQTLDFCQSVGPTLEGYDADGVSSTMSID